MDAHSPAPLHHALNVPEILHIILAHLATYDDHNDAAAAGPAAAAAGSGSASSLLAAAQVCSSWADAATCLIWRAPPAAALAAVHDAARRQHYYAPKVRELVLSADGDAAIAHYECIVGRHAYYDADADAGHGALAFPRLQELVFDPGALAAEVAVDDLERLVGSAVRTLRVLTMWETSADALSMSGGEGEEEGGEKGEEGKRGRVAQALVMLQQMNLPALQSLAFRTVDDDVPAPTGVLEFLEAKYGLRSQLKSLALMGTMRNSVDTAVLALLAYRCPKLEHLELDYSVTLADIEALTQADRGRYDGKTSTERTRPFTCLKELGLGVSSPPVVAILVPAIRHIACLTLNIHNCDAPQLPATQSSPSTWAPRVVLQAITASLTALIELELTFCKGIHDGGGGSSAIVIGTADLLALRIMGGLRALSIRGVPASKLTARGLCDVSFGALVAALPRLRELCLNVYAPLLTAQALRAAGMHCPQLERLELYDDYDVRDLGSGVGLGAENGTVADNGESIMTASAASPSAEAGTESGDETVDTGGTSARAATQPLFPKLRALRLGAARVRRYVGTGDPYDVEDDFEDYYGGLSETVCALQYHAPALVALSFREESLFNDAVARRFYKPVPGAMHRRS